MDRIAIILQFWFEGVKDTDTFDKSKNPFKKWFIKDKKFDDEICLSFEADLIKASNGKYVNWEATVEGRLALILLFDQFSRNMYRESPLMFAFDDLALDLSQRSIGESVDKKLSLVQRVFLYLPLMHAEDLIMQDLCVAKMKEMIEESKKKCPPNTHYFQYTLEYAYRHHNIIKEFGRFPHRNEILQRVSTPEEMEFLKTKGSSF